MEGVVGEGSQTFRHLSQLLTCPKFQFRTSGRLGWRGRLSGLGCEEALVYYELNNKIQKVKAELEALKLLKKD